MWQVYVVLLYVCGNFLSCKIHMNLIQLRSRKGRVWDIYGVYYAGIVDELLMF